jgi:uncharacterized protein YdaU (DUF1376 family)
MSKAWMPFYIGDYLRDTRRLTMAQHGAYLLLIMEYWDRGPLPNDDVELARILGIPVRQWKLLAVTVRSYFTEANAKQLLRHKRIDKEIIKAEETSQKRALAGFKGGTASRGKTNLERNFVQAFAKQRGDQSQSHSNLTSFSVAAREARKRSAEEEG